MCILGIEFVLFIRVRISADFHLTFLIFSTLLSIIRKYILKIKRLLYLNIGFREHCLALSVYIGKTNEAIKKYYLFY